MLINCYDLYKYGNSHIYVTTKITVIPILIDILKVKLKSVLLV